MGFLFPLFLIAGLAIAIPIAIHLFNLRKYKKVDFPSLRFLNSIVVQNKKISAVQKKWLLAARIATLAFLVFAFAQPFLNKDNSFNSSNSQAVIYIDNSMSMEYKLGQQNLLDKAKIQAAAWIQQQSRDQFYIISNDNLYYAQALTKLDALQAIQKIQLTSATVTAEHLKNALENLKEQLYHNPIQVIAFSDFQANIWHTSTSALQSESVHYILFPVKHDENAKPNNIYIDTAFFAEAPVDALQEIPLVTAIKKTGNEAASTTITTQINGLSVHTKNIEMSESDSLLWDTTILQISGGKWNHISQSIRSRALTFDDNYHLSAAISPAMNVVIYNQNNSNGYLTNALATQKNIHPLQHNLAQLQPSIDNTQQSLIIFQGLTTLSNEHANWIKELLIAGKSVAITFDKGLNRNQFNDAIKAVAPISIVEVDTSFQQIVDLQSTHPLLQGVLAQIPNNVQLPYSQYSYVIKAGITAAGQDVMRFRSGNPFIAQYNVHNAKLYIFAAPLIPDATNLISSHYFAPIMYKMAINSNVGNVFSAEIAPNQQVWIQNHSPKTDKDLYHLFNTEIDIIPKQQSRGIGTSIIIPESLPKDGFYTLAQSNKQQQYDIGLNYNREESIIIAASAAELLNTFGNSNTTIIHSIQQLQEYSQTGSHFPLWKWAIIIALLMLLLETYILWKKPNPKEASK